MEKGFSGADRLEVLGQEIICLISLGKKESVVKILEEMTKKNVVRYLYDKYRGDWFFSLDGNCPYNIDDWENIFCESSYMTCGDVKRKLGIRNEDDGLLVVLSLILEELQYLRYARGEN